jgi:hypothetical protein
MTTKKELIYEIELILKSKLGLDPYKELNYLETRLYRSKIIELVNAHPELGWKAIPTDKESWKIVPISQIN